VGIWKAEKCCDLENGADFPFLVFMEGKEIICVSRIWRYIYIYIYISKRNINKKKHKASDWWMT